MNRKKEMLRRLVIVWGEKFATCVLLAVVKIDLKRELPRVWLRGEAAVS